MRRLLLSELPVQSPQTSELRAAVHVDGIAGDPAGMVGGQEGNDATDVVGLCKAFKRLHAQREVSARVCLGEVRHVRLDDARRHCIDADAAAA